MNNHRLKGLASEMLFAARWYELVEDESLTLITPDLDTGWDFMIASSCIKVQVKRHTKSKRYNPYNLDLRRRRNKGTGNYTGKEFDYLAIHNTESDEFIIADVKQLMNGDVMKQSVGIKSLTNLGMCHLVEVSQGLASAVPFCYNTKVIKGHPNEVQSSTV
mgnify:CR=1 FL=1